jgi:hypothetical protein
VSRYSSLYLGLLLLAIGLLQIMPAPAIAHPTEHTARHTNHPADYPYPHVHSLVRDPADDRHIFALGNPDAYESFDGGQTWQARGGGVPTAHYARLIFEPVSRHLWSYTPGIAGFHRSTDSGWTWPMLTEFLLRDVVARSANGSPQLLAIAHNLRFMISDDGGATWNERAAPWGLAGDARLMQLHPEGTRAPETLIVVAGGATYRSADGGVSWERYASWPQELTPVRLFASADRHEVYAIAHRGAFDPRPVGNTLLRSRDEGRSWEAAGVSDTWAAVGARGDRVVAASWRGDVWYHDGDEWQNPGSWKRWPLALVQPLHLREDVNPTPTVTDLLPGPQGDLVASTVLGMYRAERAGLPLELRSRGLLPTAALLTAPIEREMAPEGSRFFPQTRHALAAPFLAGWERLGGLRTLGYPLTEPYLERNVETGVDQRVQLFERGRLEEASDGTVMAARLVVETLPIQPAAAPVAGCNYSAATGHNICDRLLQTWYQLGAESWLGLPLDEAQIQNGVRVQHFERGRLEQPLSGRGAVMIGLVGREEAQRRGWLP